MSEPLYHVGQAVAVFAMEGGIYAFPATTVVMMEFVWDGERCIDGENKPYVSDGSGWYYEVADDPGITYSERSLRPIDPDTEYTNQDELERVNER